MFNFMEASQTYKNKLQEMQGENDYLGIFSIVTKLDEEPITNQEILARVIGSGFIATKQAVDKMMRQLKLTHEWLKSNRDQKEKIVAGIQKFSTKSHITFLLHGIRSLEKDGIRTLDQADIVLKTRSSDSFEEIFLATDKTLDVLIEKLNFLKDEHLRMRKEFVECLDELGDVKNKLFTEQHKYRQIQRRLEESREINKKIETKNRQLLEENESQKEEIKRLEYENANLKQDPLVQKLLAAIDKF